MPSKKALILPITLLALIFGFLATATSTFAADKERLLYSFCPVNPYECINGCPVEVAIGALHQSAVGIRAIRAAGFRTKAVKRR